MSKKGKVLLGMSGGVDSTMSIKLLLDRSYEVHGVTFVMTDEEKASKASKTAVDEAKDLAAKFGIPHQIVDIRKEFREIVIQNFIDEYFAARTPNPCVLCNRTLKFQYLLAFADKMEAPYIATGHYVQKANINDRYFVQKAYDDFKDQSYMLWNLTQEQIKRAIFPLGAMRKEQVKNLAQDIGLKSLAEKKESFDVCFIPDGDYRNFLQKNAAQQYEDLKEGDFLLSDNTKVACHKGFPNYTIGQRKGLEIALGEPMYVNKLDPEKNTVSIGPKEELLTKTAVIDSLNMQKYDELSKDMELLVKIRYHDKGEFANIIPKTDTEYIISFQKQVSAVTPGQSAVFYEDDDVVGGGIIK